jgi:ABC-type antimicrobial peptide transport system permease subunit
MKRLNIILNTIMGAFIGVFIGCGIYVIWDFKTHPELYAVQSAPWYTSILVYGAFTIVVLLVCIVIKAIIKSKQK